MLEENEFLKKEKDKFEIKFKENLKEKNSQKQQIELIL